MGIYDADNWNNMSGAFFKASQAAIQNQQNMLLARLGMACGTANSEGSYKLCGLSDYVTIEPTKSLILLLEEDV